MKDTLKDLPNDILDAKLNVKLNDAPNDTLTGKTNSMINNAVISP